MRLNDADEPLTAGDFAHLMAAFGPFERSPTVAVATSGGPDSLALAVLAADWATSRGGAARALIVDHGLRPESGAETTLVVSRLAAQGIAAEVLPWRGPKPAAGIQAAARTARMDLLGAWCRRHGVLHQLLGHQREDQIETYVMRRRRRSGPVGQAAMSACVELEHHRVLRPLLAVPRSRLKATLRVRGLDWIEDPSNGDPRFERVRVRGRLALHPALGDGAVVRAGVQRLRLDRAVGDHLAATTRFEPAGYARIEPLAWFAAAPVVRQLALRRVLMTVGGHDDPPGPEAVRRLDEALVERRGGRTLAGCRVVVDRHQVLVGREDRGIMAPVPLRDGWARWDGRFTVHGTGQDLTIGRLGVDGTTLARHVPAAIRATLPCVRNLAGIVALPHVRLRRDATAKEQDVRLRFERSRGFARPFATAPAPLARAPSHAKMLATGAA